MREDSDRDVIILVETLSQISLGLEIETGYYTKDVLPKKNPRLGRGKNRPTSRPRSLPDVRCVLVTSQPRVFVT